MAGKNFQIILLTFILTCLIFTDSKGQNNSVYENMSLNEILDVEIAVTASKHPEDLFETPLSTTIISKEEITRSGVTSIPEALRLAQGVIVREITPGNYDIHTRGYDDITKNVYLTLPYNTTTLVMINNRIVYSYFSGGTLWETFPVDINDVERIEVVRGPASALYGSNAVTGVINIITSHANKKGLNTTINGVVGSNNATNSSVNVGYNWNDKTKLSFSGNFTSRDRFNSDYFNHKTGVYTDFNDLTLITTPVKNQATNEIWTFENFINEFDIQYDHNNSLKKLGGNIFFNHHYSEQSEIELSMGAQKSQSQKSGFINLATSLSQIESKSYYFDAKIKHKNLSSQFNINSGKHYSNYEYNSYKYTDIDANIEYYKKYGDVSFRPGIAYKYLVYNSPLIYDEPMNLNTFNSDFKDEPRISSSYSAYLLSEWKPTPKLRFIGAFRVDKFDMNKNYLTNFEIASTYRINKNNLIRFAVSQANKSPFFFDSYLNTSMLMSAIYEDEVNNTSIDVPIDLQINGQEDLKYPIATNFEFGWRTKINQELYIDMELFHSKVNNFVNPNVYREQQLVQYVNDLGERIGFASINVKADVIFENYELSTHQLGTGITLNYKPTDKINAKLFGTYQNTKMEGKLAVVNKLVSIEIGDVTPDNTVQTTVNYIMNPTKWSEKRTPSFFGGFSVNYAHNNKWNFETDAYVYSKQKFDSFDYYSLFDEEEVTTNNHIYMDIKTNMILNAKASYKFAKKTTSYLILKNLLGNHREYGFVDQIGSQLLIGLKWEF